jgi:hypothetical protein
LAQRRRKRDRGEKGRKQRASGPPIDIHRTDHRRIKCHTQKTRLPNLNGQSRNDSRRDDIKDIATYDKPPQTAAYAFWQSVSGRVAQPIFI